MWCCKRRIVMSRYLRWLLACLALAATLPYVSAQSAPQEQTSSGRPETATAASSAFIPLPKSCGGGLPVGANVPACCMFGYVFIDGQAVSGAKVTITSALQSVDAWTEQGPDSPLPYYRTSLSGQPLNAQ